MVAQEIIEKWLKYSQYDPDEHRFILGSSHHEMHKISDAVGRIMEYDPQCVMSVLYVKTRFENMCRQAKTSLFDVLNGTTGLDENDREMWTLLHSEDIQAVETSILDRMSEMLQKASKQDQIGARDLDKERESLADAIVSVVDELCKCHVDLFLSGGMIQPVDLFDTQLHVFNTVSECLFALEKAPDAAYVCYVSNDGTADGYFGYYIKSNGSILSVNERVNEAYPGQHNHSRNGRWAESKKYNLFPYEIVSGENFDYKGYARKLIVNEAELEIFRLSPETYLPLTLGLIMLSNKYAYTDPSTLPLKFVDTMLPANLQLAGQKDSALVPLQNSLVAKASAAYEIPFTAEDILTGSPANLFTRSVHPERRYGETGFFLQEENIFVKLYGEGFLLDTQQLLTQPKYKELPSSVFVDPTTYENYVEFVGTKERMDMIAYFNGRRQLAEYIRDRMFEEYTQTGGVEAIQTWYNQQILNSKDRLLKLCVKRWNEVKVEGKRMPGSLSSSLVKREGLDYIRFCENTKGKLESEFTGFRWRKIPFNKTQDWQSQKLLCPITGSVTSIHFVFQPDTWKDMEEMFGVEVPKVLKGYERMASRSLGNSILDVTDAVASVGNVFEDGEQAKNRRLWTKSAWERHFFYNHDQYPDWGNREVPEGCLSISPSAAVFNVEIAFSKRGWKKILADYAEQREKAKEETKSLVPRIEIRGLLDGSPASL